MAEVKVRVLAVQEDGRAWASDADEKSSSISQVMFSCDA